jgi:hypothetical protein
MLISLGQDLIYMVNMLIITVSIVLVILCHCDKTPETVNLKGLCPWFQRFQSMGTVALGLW